MASAEEKAEMEEEAREEWEDRGFDPDEFELEKMIEMWEVPASKGESETMKEKLQGLRQTLENTLKHKAVFNPFRCQPIVRPSSL